MATLPRVAAPVNGRPARSRTAARKVAGTPAPIDEATYELISNPAPPRLVGYWGQHGIYMAVVDYPPDTRPYPDHITPEQHRQAFADLMRMFFVRLPFIGTRDLRIQILFPKRLECGRLVFEPRANAKGEYETLTQAQLFELSVNPIPTYEYRPPLVR